MLFKIVMITLFTSSCFSMVNANEAPNISGFYLALFPWVGFSAGPMTARLISELVLGRHLTIPLDGISVLAD